MSSNTTKIMNGLRIGGAALIVLALILTWMAWTWTALTTLVIVGIIDLFLVFAKEDTISQWIHRQFPKSWDVVIMIGLGVFTWFVFGAAGFLPVVMGIILGHLFWND